MNYKRCLDLVFKRYGQDVTYLPYGESSGESFKAFIRPLRYKNKMYLEGELTAIGLTDQSYFLYIGPADKPLSKSIFRATIVAAGETYEIKKSENVFIGNEVAYIWAILQAVRREEV